jgi:hemerythrin
MSRVIWSDDFSIGNEEIDTQHKELIRILDNLNQSIVNKGENHSIKGTILELQHYAVLHFSTEEVYMCDLMYEELENHIQQHDFFRAKVKELHSLNIVKGCDKSLELVQFITEWLLNHVMAEDKKIPFIPGSSYN